MCRQAGSAIGAALCFWLFTFNPDNYRDNYSKSKSNGQLVGRHKKCDIKNTEGKAGGVTQKDWECRFFCGTWDFCVTGL
ncbi:MAG: hypothetical protein COW63_11010 [Bacteroidetes bacterium CG18_big_fil_WC_8_21_14_2_50_41_14]|nr:MAG: hypothetical protein COW63_11010 [Bacteroidetes bacterium CG18_big_fil_WC_8_21_14_2_50_41_14]